jgi:GNAT superfamily N-acetyltransferase
VAVRHAEVADRVALVAMAHRCTDRSRQARFLAPLRGFPEPYLTEALAGIPEHEALVVEVGDAIVALASCRTVDDGVELAVLVEDDHQRQGIGGRLLDTLVEHADRAGIGTLRATVAADQAWLVRLLRRYGTCRATVSHGVFEVTVRRP